MPWKECDVVEERLRFIARLLDGEKMAGHQNPEQRTARASRPRHHRPSVRASVWAPTPRPSC